MKFIIKILVDIKNGENMIRIIILFILKILMDMNLGLIMMKMVMKFIIKILMEMGHGDTIVIADGNFPCHTCGQRVVRLDGHNVPEILEAILNKIFLK